MKSEQTEPLPVEEGTVERNLQQSERTIFFFDGDRCTWNTERFMDIIYEKLELRGISRALLATMKEETEATGGSFDTFDTLRSRYEKELVDGVADEVEQEAAARRDLPYDDPRCLFMPGAREMLASVAPENRVLLTRGGEEMQLIKLRGIVGIDTDKDLFEITDRDDKGAMLVESYDSERGVFVFRWIRNAPGDIEATHVTLVEDKGKAFAGIEHLGDKANGYWYQNPDEAQLPSQLLPENTVLPPNVEIVQNLFTIQDATSSLGAAALTV